MPLSQLSCAGLCAAVIALPSCRSLVDRPDTAPEVSAADFSLPMMASSTAILVPSEVFAPERVVTETVESSDDGAERVTTTTSRVEQGPDGKEVDIPVASREEIRVQPGQRWTVDSLVGQINGRAVYASQFLQSVEDRILRIVAENPQVTAKMMIENLVAERFEQYINNELIIAEAEGMLTPDMQLGILAWLDSVQQQTVAGYGGNLAQASQTLQDQFGMSMEEYLREKRDEALAQDLLRRRVKPRTIVSWRDIEREYVRFEKEFNPAPVIWIGRIQVAASEVERLKDVETRIARGESFAEIAKALALPDDGIWTKFDLPANGIDGLEFADDIKSLLKASTTGALTAAHRKPSGVTWYCVVRIQSAQGRGLFDPILQRQIRLALEEQRGKREQYRYLAKLRDRWVTTDIKQMTRRLTDIAWHRYLPKA